MLLSAARALPILLGCLVLVSLAAAGKVRGKFELIKGIGEVQHYVSPPLDANSPSLVFIHTTGHTSEIWKNACTDKKGVHVHRRKTKYCNVLEQVALAGYGVYAMDLPGHGKSAKTCVRRPRRVCTHPLSDLEPRWPGRWCAARG
jgi:pimeloyl-ACP methyl ester carboxylesterase